MKQSIALAFCLGCIAPVFSQTLFTYGGKPVSRSEFVKAFDKNPSADTASRRDALKNYLDLYIKYKLKVQAAYDDRLHTTDEYKSEAANFKREMAETAINNEADISHLVQEAFVRSRTDIQLAQIFIPAPAGSDTAAAFRQISEAYDLLQKGKPFGELVSRFAADSATRKNGGNIGYITVFSLPYDAETLVYGTKPGNFTPPYHSRIGYHIFKVVSERPALGSRKIQSILFAYSPAASDAEKEAAGKLADSVYNLLQGGASFSDMQVLYGTQKAGSRPTIEIGVGQYSPDFESAVYGLQNTGDITRPFPTAYGYNIVKLIEKGNPSPDTSDLAVKAMMQQKLSSDDRLASARQSLQGKWLAATGYKPGTYKAADLWTYTDSSLAGASPSSARTISESTVLFSFAQKKVTVADWLRYVQMKIQEGNARPDYKTLMPQFTAYATANYYAEHIDDFHPGLKAQLAEFNEANLLFAAMDKYVWSKASQDSAGLLRYYKAHADRYTWAPGADAIVVTANNKQVAGELLQKIKDSPSEWQEITASYGSLAQADSSRFENEQMPVKAGTMLQANTATDPVPVNDGNGYTFLYVTRLHPAAEPRTFGDARGMVINDYQQVVEDNWIAQLKKKYPVKVNEAVFQRIR